MIVTAITIASLLSGVLGSYDSLAKCLYEEEVADAQDTLWNKANCNEDGTGAIEGLVVDAVCANAADQCPAKTDANSCGASVGCTWDAGACKWRTDGGCLSRTTEDACGTDRCKWEGGSCIWNRDAQNNVCLHPPTGHTTLPDATRNCADILKGRCPLSWEVPTGCCLEEHSKYEMLLESTPGFVCCNAPCTSLEASHTAGTQVHLFALTEVTTGTGLVVANQTVCNGNMGSTLCAPGMRSYFGRQTMGRGGGLMDRNMQMSTMGMYGGRPMYGGRVIGGYGTIGLPGMGFMNQVDLDNEEGLDSKEGHVEEISMDDFMETLIEALDTDADVFESDRQITSDPWFGKQRFSLGPNGIKLGNPMDIFGDIYGNPGFGMPGGMGPFGPFGGRGPFGPMGRMGPYGRGGYGGGFGSPFGMGGFPGGYGMGYGSPYGSPYGFSNYGPRPYGQPQGFGQQPPASGPQPVPTDPTQRDGQILQQQQPAGYQPLQQPAFVQQPAYPQPAYPQQAYPQQPAYPQPPAYGQQPAYPQGAAAGSAGW